MEAPWGVSMKPSRSLNMKKYVAWCFIGCIVCAVACTLNLLYQGEGRLVWCRNMVTRVMLDWGRGGAGTCGSRG